MFLKACPETPNVVKVGQKSAWQFTSITKDVVASDNHLLKQHFCARRVCFVDVDIQLNNRHNALFVFHRKRDHTNKPICYKYTAYTIEIYRGFYETIVRLSGDHTNTDHGHIFTIPKRLTFYDELHNSDAFFFFLLSEGLPVANAPDVLQPCGLLYYP